MACAETACTRAHGGEGTTSAGGRTHTNASRRDLLEEPSERQLGEQSDLAKVLDPRFSDAALPPRNVHLVDAQRLREFTLSEAETLGAGFFDAVGYNQDD